MTAISTTLRCLRLIAVSVLLMPLGCGDRGDSTGAAACAQDTDCNGRGPCVDGTCRDEVTTTSADVGEPPTTDGADGGQTSTEGDGSETSGGGDPCQLGGNVCLDAATLGVCNTSDQSTTPVSCDASCASMGFSSAIGCSAATDGKHQCYCDQASASCMESSCGGGKALVECVDGVINVTDCEQECESDGLPGDCGYDEVTASYFCNCTGPYLCTENATFCQDASTEMRCIEGAWQPRPCSDEECHAAQCADEFSECPADYEARSLGCGYDNAIGDTGCLCTN